MTMVLRDSINESHRGLVGDKLYDLFDRVFVGDSSWPARQKTSEEVVISWVRNMIRQFMTSTYPSSMKDRAPRLVAETNTKNTP